MKTLISVFFICLILTSSAQTEKQLPKPSGKFLTGVDYLSFIDQNRKELFDNTGKNKREITVKFWYPADEKKETELYLEDPEFIINNFPFSESYKSLKTNSCRGIPVSHKESKYPVLIFSHGWGEHFSQNTILMEELASHGYIVFSLAHHYECKFSIYPNGRIITLNPESTRFQQIIQEQQNPEAMEVFGKMGTASTDDERLDIFVQSNRIMPTLLVESPRYWAEDISFFIKQLQEINNSNNVLRNKLDLEKIGVFGMSMGGIASGEVCTDNLNIKAGASLDGGLYGSLTDNNLNVPFLFINTQRYLGYGNLFVCKSDTDCYSITIKNSDHYNLTDYGIFQAENQVMLGTIDPYIPVKLLNNVIVDFFDKYIKGISTINMKDCINKFDIEFVTNK
ncbi:MAG: hypothetical protein JXR31_10355 [Prolixibacteraceae bacterium]|nr:hypothetical protein [Prolixibacteraceae bacterium]MBN2774640.1 hypothetical protein [Prolixibacteraceae bacterium]